MQCILYKIFLGSFSYELQFDMHFDMHSYLHKKNYSCKKWVLQGKTELSSGMEKLVLGNANQLPGNVDQLSRKPDLETKPS
jgi:hypothetical protein